MAISDQTTGLSNLALTGNLQIAGQISSNTSTNVLAYSKISSDGSILGNAVWASSFSEGGAAFPARFSATSFLVVAQVVQGSASTFTICTTVTDVKKGDILLPNPLGGAGVSSISSGLVWTSHATQDGQFEFRYSNVSTLVQNQSAQTFNLAIIRL